METETTVQIVSVLAAAYPRQAITKDTIKLYEQTLQDIPVEVLKAAALDHISRSKWFPSVSELRDAAFGLMRDPDDPTAFQGWEQVMRALYEGAGHPIVGRSKSFDFVHERVQRCVRYIGGWTYLSQSENLTADRARFVQAYEQQAERDESSLRMLPAVKALADTLALESRNAKRLSVGEHNDSGGHTESNRLLQSPGGERGESTHPGDQDGDETGRSSVVIGEQLQDDLRSRGS